MIAQLLKVNRLLARIFKLGLTDEAVALATPKRYIIDYYTHEGNLGDCYPDFCSSRREAEKIAPVFMRHLNWAGSYKIREIIDDEEKF